MANHEVSLNGSRPVPVGNVDIEAIVRRDGRALGGVKISRDSIDWLPANKSKRGYWLEWNEFAKLMREQGNPL